MNRFLLQQDAAFYHVTSFRNWASIQAQGVLYARDGKVFLCRSAIRAMHYFIATSQVLDLNVDQRFVVLRLRQDLNHFVARDFKADFQSNEVTMPFHSVLITDGIPLAQIELVETIDVDDPVLGNESNRLITYLEHSPDFEAALETEYTLGQGALYRVGYVRNGTSWDFFKIF